MAEEDRGSCSSRVEEAASNSRVAEASPVASLAASLGSEHQRFESFCICLGVLAWSIIWSLGIPGTENLFVTRSDSIEDPSVLSASIQVAFLSRLWPRCKSLGSALS